MSENDEKTLRTKTFSVLMRHTKGVLFDFKKYEELKVWYTKEAAGN